MANQSRGFKKFMAMAYGLGAAIVIVGALFKIIHFEIGPLTGNVMLTIGLVTEALIFAISAFEPIEEETDWSLVYPELAGGEKRKKDAVKPKDEKGLLSEKLDAMLKEAKLDASVFASLGESVKNFEGAAKGIAPTVDSIASQRKYSEEMTLAAQQMESLNGLYKIQLESSEKQSAANQAIADNATKLKEQMESLATNLSSLNGVYGGMLSAMSKN